MPDAPVAVIPTGLPAAPSAPVVVTATGLPAAPSAPVAETATGLPSAPGAPVAVQPHATSSVSNTASLTITGVVGFMQPPSPAFRFAAVTPGAGGNAITVRFDGTTDPSPTGPYAQATVTSLVAINTDIVFNWGPTQSQLSAATVIAAIASSSPASALVSASEIGGGIINWPVTAASLAGGGMGLTAPTAVLPTGLPSAPTAPVKVQP